MEEVLVRLCRVARSTSGCKTLACEAIGMTFLAAIPLRVFNETRRALCQAGVILLKEVEVIADAALRALGGSVLTLETLCVTELTPVAADVEVAVGSALIHARLLLQEGPASSNVRRDGVTGQALGGRVDIAVCAGVVALRVDGKTILYLVYEVEESVVDLVVCGELERLSLFACIRRSQTGQSHSNLLGSRRIWYKGT